MILPLSTEVPLYAAITSGRSNSQKSHQQRVKSQKQLNIHLRNEEWFESQSADIPTSAYQKTYVNSAGSNISPRLRNRTLMDINRCNDSRVGSLC